MTLTVGSLFSGIGGIDLGLERAGMKVLWQVEIDEWCRAVLAKHWPDVERFEDVREVGAHNLERVDVIAGGFPCQDISLAGHGAGISGPRSGLWSEYARLIRELRPRYVLVENVSALLARGLDVVLADLAAVGYDAEWDCIPASAVGAPHRRDRVWLVAYPQSHLRRAPRNARPESLDWGRADVADAYRTRSQGLGAEPELGSDSGEESSRGSRSDTRTVADTTGNGRLPRWQGDPAQESRGRKSNRGGVCPNLSDAYGESSIGTPVARQERGHWAVEPNVGRVAHGVPNRVDRLRGLGNAVVPQVVEWIGRRIVEAEEAA
jgi:DNA (cytosine-5)-methyltransferase 1